MHIIIIGAGMGGLTAALALQQAGYQVSVYEEAPVLGDVGAGLTLSPNSTCVYKHLGLLDELRQLSEAPAFSVARHYQTGEELMRYELDLEGKYGSPYLQIHRADLHKLLVEKVQSNSSGAIHLDRRFTAFEQDTLGVTAQFANGETAHGDILIGADGLRSAVRTHMFDPEPPKFTGHVAWRGLIPAKDLPSLPTPASGISIGPKRVFVRYYVRNRDLINFVAFARMDGWEIESWSEHADMDELRATFGDWNEEVGMLLDAVPVEQCFKWALFGREPLANWTQDRVTLLGDAAHPMLPFLGMGAGTAIEDGLVFARALKAETNPEAALKRYEAARKPRADFIMAESQKRVSQLQGDNPENRDNESDRNEITLGLFEYEAGTIDI